MTSGHSALGFLAVRSSTRFPSPQQKSALRRIDPLALTIEIHSDSSLFAVDVSTSLSPCGRIARPHLLIRFTTARAFSQRTSLHRKPCFAGSTASHSPSKFTAIGVSVPRTYPHPEPLCDRSLAGPRQTASQQFEPFRAPHLRTVNRASRCGRSRSPSQRTAIRVSVQPTYARRTHRSREPTFWRSPIERTASRLSSRQPCRRQSRTQADGIVLAIARKIRATRQCAQRLPISRAPASRFASTPPLTDKKHSASSPFDADLSTHAADVLAHANTIHRRNADSQAKSRGTDTTAKPAWR